jgi:hypothetical protein
VDDAVGGDACGSAAPPASLTKKIDQSIAALDAAGNQSPAKAKRTRARARKLLKAAGSLAARGARGKKPKLTAACADAIRGALSDIIGSIPR